MLNNNFYETIDGVSKNIKNTQAFNLGIKVVRSKETIAEGGIEVWACSDKQARFFVKQWIVKEFGKGTGFQVIDGERDNTSINDRELTNMNTHGGKGAYSQKKEEEKVMKKFVKVSMVGITVNEIELKSALTEGLKMASENNCVLYLAGDGRNEDHVKKFITAISKGIEYAAHYGVNYRVISVYGTKDELPKKRHKQVDYVVAANISTISAETRALLIRDALVNKANFMVGDAPVSPTEPEKDNKKENPVVSQNVLQDNVEWHDDLDDIPDETFGVSSENGPVIIYTDGAAKGNSQSSPAGWAFVYQDGSKKESGSFFGSNNVAELLAIKKALESTSESAEVEIHSDSQYSIGVLGGSKDGSIPFMKAKTNLNLIAEIQDLMASKTVTFVKVKGHDGHPMNELVDKMASDAAKDNNG